MCEFAGKYKQDFVLIFFPHFILHYEQRLLLVYLLSEDTLEVPQLNDIVFVALLRRLQMEVHNEAHDH